MAGRWSVAPGVGVRVHTTLLLAERWVRWPGTCHRDTSIVLVLARGAMVTPVWFPRFVTGWKTKAAIRVCW